MPKAKPAVAAETMSRIPLHLIAPDPKQDRKHFDEEELANLADSIREQDVIQPILVRPAAPGRFEIIAGERRWRAAQIAELTSIPAVVRHDVDDDKAHTLQLTENIQKASLRPIELAHGLARKVAAVGLIEAAASLGKSKSWVSQRATLLDLPEPILDLVRRGILRDVAVPHLLKQVSELDARHFNELIELYNEDPDAAPGRDALEGTVRAMKEDKRTIEAAKAAAASQRSMFEPEPTSLAAAFKSSPATPPPAAPKPSTNVVNHSVKDVKAAASRQVDEERAKIDEIAARLSKRLTSASGDDLSHVFSIHEKDDNGLDRFAVEVTLTEAQIDAACAAIEGGGEAPPATKPGPGDAELLDFLAARALTPFPAEHMEVAAGELYAAYSAYCAKARKDPAPPQVLAWLLEIHGFQKRRDKKGAYWIGIALKGAKKAK
jgi:ParB/RepB/Spo0J family partition protein